MTEQNAPVVGVIVDNDHDGEPDVFERSTALVGRPDYEPVPVQPASAELVTPAEEQALAWRRVIETRPVVPPWMSDREQRALAIRWAGRYFWHRVKFHAFHSPRVRVEAGLPLSAGPEAHPGLVGSVGVRPGSPATPPGAGGRW